MADMGGGDGGHRGGDGGHRGGDGGHRGGDGLTYCTYHRLEVPGIGF
jgi:hypothetical protein